MSYASDLYAEIIPLLNKNTGMKRRYQHLRRLMDRMLKERTSHQNVEYCGTVPRLYALGKQYPSLPLRPLSILWNNAQQVSKGELELGEQDFYYDLKALCQGITILYDENPPTCISTVLPENWRAIEKQPDNSSQVIPKLRVIVRNWDDSGIDAISVEDYHKIHIEIDPQGPWRALPEQLYEGAQLNLLSYQNRHAELIVLDPDYLIDITSICQCIKSCEASPIWHLMNKLTPGVSGLALQLGNVANQFLDDLVNYHATSPLEQNEQYKHSLQKNFKDYVLEYCALPGVDVGFFENCKQQYNNLRQVTTRGLKETGIDIELNGIQLEPSFLSEALGLQGRLDLLTTDLQHIVELKSGKRDEFHDTYKIEHALQMALYKEILYRSLNRNRSNVQTLLLYSKYPKLYDIRLGEKAIAEAISLRNGIVHLERILRNGNIKELFRNLKEEDFNPSGQSGKFYDNWIKPQIQHFLAKLQGASDLELDYISTMLSFTQREQFLAKVGDDRPDSDHGFAQTWLASTQEKQAAGNMITGVKLSPIYDENGQISQLHADISEIEEEQAQPNFRTGDLVTLYERNSEDDNITNRQVIRCNIEEIHPDWILLRLCVSQSNTLWLHKNRFYAIEISHLDSTFNVQYRGLYDLLGTTEKRRQLILGQRLPQRDENITLCRKVKDPELREIILHAMQAQDYYLLIGPPGTGKTSVALKNIVEELLIAKPQENILLMAYTNRAVDEICEMVQQISTKPDYIRIGHELSCGENYQKHLLKNSIRDCKNRQEVISYLSSVKIFCGTVSSLSSQQELFKLKRFGTALLDEASQVLEPQLMPLLCQTTTLEDGKKDVAIQRFIFIGDHKQLPAVVTQHPAQSAVNNPELNEIGLLNCRDSLFERLHRLAIKNGQKGLIGLLSRQGRMHPSISQFVNKHYYDNRLGIVPVKHQLEEIEWKKYDSSNKQQEYLATHRKGFVNVTSIPNYDDNNKVNSREAVMVALMVEGFYQLTIKNKYNWEPEKKIGIIVPFRGQISMIRKELEHLKIPKFEKITIDTVERYQGSQRDIILFSTVISQHYQLEILSAPVESDGQMIDRKLNVAITRARKQFFLIGNEKLLLQAPDYKELIADLKE